ncbi:MAG TPA: hypothetical protein VFF02_06205 [Anaeromyxobacteraceae bacterium]|nr:hypothetical protein [Anaeromyxobacteraceae bacterium]
MPLEQWTGTLTLSPEQQAIFESQQRIQGGRSQLAEDLLGGARDELGRPVDWQGFPARPDDMEAARNRAEANIYGRYASRLDPQFQQREQALTSQLYNQGLRPGDEAWDTAMANLGRERTDAYQTALRESVMGGGTEARAAGQYQQGLRSSAIAEELQRRGWSLNEIQALLGGAQVGLPQMPSFAQAGAAQATQYLPAAQQQFNNAMQGWQAQQQANQGFLSGLAGIGSIPFMF